ncbi:hypothetical protein SELMODRAFT_426306 [Selaginella moellendorffii]|uniref:Uncharacterized protein n=1 Tax=Selaginella moellendorffii TaxID=88036 RepID=D8SVZ6_SELML|nr:hypothetical protein SELMODRAFT_426306 [Selaginella moellendorffii]
MMIVLGPLLQTPGMVSSFPTAVATCLHFYNLLFEHLERRPLGMPMTQRQARMITETGWELGVYHFLRDDVVLLWNDPETAIFREDLIFTYYLSGARHVIVPGWRRGMTLVDCGFATLLESSDGVEPFAPIVPYIRGVTNNEAQAPGLLVTIGDI